MLFLGLVVFVGLIVEYPWEAVPILVALAALTVWLVRRSRNRAHPYTAEQADAAMAHIYEVRDQWFNSEVSYLEYKTIEEEQMTIVRGAPRGWKPSDPPRKVLP